MVKNLSACSGKAPASHTYYYPCNDIHHANVVLQTFATISQGFEFTFEVPIERDNDTDIEVTSALRNDDSSSAEETVDGNYGKFVRNDDDNRFANPSASISRISP